MKKTVLLLVLFLGTLALGMAQSKENDFLEQPYIEVTGTAMMEVVPDEIYVKIILREKDQRGKTELEQQEKKLFQTLQKVGIDVKKDLAVRNMAGNRYKLKSGAMKLRKEYVLLLHDVNALDRVFAGLEQMGGVEAEVERVDHSQMEKLREIYKAEEERLAAEAKQKEEQDSQLSEEELNKIVGTLREAGKNIKTIGGFDLEESDIDSTMDYITKPQITGRTKLASDLDNPDTLFKLAFYATHGDELIEAIHEHYNNVLNDEEYLKNRLEKLSKLKNKKRSNNTSNLSTGKGNKIENSDLKSFLNLKD